MLRFLFFAVPLLVLTLGVVTFGFDVSGHGPSVGRFLPWDAPVAGGFVLATWFLEAMALTAFFLLIQGRSAWSWLDGLFAALIAWVFRGPLLVISVAGVTREPPHLWWELVIRWLPAYVLSGLVLAAVARFTGLDPWRDGRTVIPGPPTPA